MIYFKIDQSLSCDKICKSIQRLLEKTPDSQGQILVIELRKTSYETNDMLPRLEYKGDECI